MEKKDERFSTPNKAKGSGVAYRDSPLKNATDKLLADLAIDLTGAAAKQVPKTPENPPVKAEAKVAVSDNELRQAVKKLVKSELDKGNGISRKKTRESLEKEFGVSLVDRKGFIVTIIDEALDYFDDLEKEQEKGPKAQPTIDVTTKPSDQANEVKVSTPTAAQPDSSQASVPLNTQETLPNTQDTKVSSALTDTRHDKTSEPSAKCLPFLVSKKVGNYGSFLPVLVELHKPEVDQPPVNLTGDSGMIGRVSMVDADGNARSMNSPKKKQKKKDSEKVWSEKAARRYAQGSSLRIDLKGDVYHGFWTNSAASICAVSVNPAKEAKVDYVFHQYVQASFQSNVLKSMGGHHVDDEGVVMATPLVKKRKKA